MDRFRVNMEATFWHMVVGMRGDEIISTTKAALEDMMGMSFDAMCERLLPSEVQQQDFDDRRRAFNKKVLTKRAPNAFSYFAKEQRKNTEKEFNTTKSPFINKALGQKWHALTTAQQRKYYLMAHVEKHPEVAETWKATIRHDQMMFDVRISSLLEDVPIGGFLGPPPPQSHW